MTWVKTQLLPSGQKRPDKWQAKLAKWQAPPTPKECPDCGRRRPERVKRCACGSYAQPA